MKKLVIVILLSFLLSWPVIANDGVFYAQGNTLIPLQETQVELRKEVLKFYLVDHNFAKVDVYFEFFNPGPTKTVTVGFVTPPAEGDISEQAAKKPFISAFTVDVNGRKLPFKIKRLRETTFNLATGAAKASKLTGISATRSRPGKLGPINGSTISSSKFTPITGFFICRRVLSGAKKLLTGKSPATA
jgi:hypothetical protein